MTTNGYRQLPFMTVLFAVSDMKPHAYWLLTRFTIIARYVERMLDR